jgi:hypothetical protein
MLIVVHHSFICVHHAVRIIAGDVVMLWAAGVCGAHNILVRDGTVNASVSFDSPAVYVVSDH